MYTIEVLAPCGAKEITQLHASRLDSLEGKTIAMLSNDSWQVHRMFPLLKEYLEKRFDDITVIPQTEFPMGSGGTIDTDAVADLIKQRGVHAVIVGNAA